MVYNAENGTAIYRSRMHAKTKRNFEIFSAEEFIAAITQHIPDKGFQMVRYYGWYSNRARGERAKREIPGVIHADGTARVQTVTAGENAFVHALLDALEALGQPPVVVNTSLNLRGEPIVNTAEEALTAARAMRLDGIVLGDWIGPLRA